MMERHGKHVIVEKPTFMRPSQLTAAYATQRRGLHVFPVCQTATTRRCDGSSRP